MKKFLIIFSVIAVAMFSSCTSTVADAKKEDVTLYATSTDSTVVVYRYNSKDPIVLKKPISVDQLQKYAIPYSVIENLGKNPGMARYVGGDENDAYDLSDGTQAWLAISVVIAFVFLILLLAIIFSEK